MNSETETKQCAICGSTLGVKGKTGKYKMDLCQKHYRQISYYGKILDKTRNDTNDIIVMDDYAEIILLDKHFAVSGKNKIDIDDIDKVKTLSWTLYKSSGNRAPYVVNIKNNYILSRYILGLDNKDSREVIFKNKDTLDCRKNNLIIATASQRMQNSKIFTTNTSGYKGVCWLKKQNKWMAKIIVNYKQIYLGAFSDIQDAVAARKSAEEKYFGEFAYNPDKEINK